MWSDTFDGHNNSAWPGTQISKDSYGRYVVDVDASKSYDSIIFDNNTDQTVDIKLADCEHEGTFVLGSKNTEGKYQLTYKPIYIYIKH